MNLKQKIKITSLVRKYNDILMESIKCAITEDLIKLTIDNRDDENFELIELVKQRNSFSDLIIKEFLKQNSKGVLENLHTMEEVVLSLNNRQKQNLKKKENANQLILL